MTLDGSPQFLSYKNETSELHSNNKKVILQKKSIYIYKIPQSQKMVYLLSTRGRGFYHKYNLW